EIGAFGKAQFRVMENGPVRARVRAEKFDQSSHEFNGELDFADSKYNLTFTVAQSDPAKNWPALQPGSQNKSMGGRTHPYTILFNLVGQPKGLYRLKVAVILTRSRVPGLLVDINGHTGKFFFDRQPELLPR